MKKCHTCKQNKKMSDFHLNKKKKDGRATRCRKCKGKAYREAVIKEPVKHNRSNRNRQYVRKYGITIEDYEAMYASQNGSCDICGIHQDEINTRLCVDHCHATGKVRSLLCDRCNTLLGMAREDVDILASAISYLINSRI